MRVFVTGASGFIGSAVVPELIDAGPRGRRPRPLGRGRRGARERAGAEVHRGDLDDLESLRTRRRRGRRRDPPRLHPRLLAARERRAASTCAPIETFGAALEGSDRPLVIASGHRAARAGPGGDRGRPARPGVARLAPGPPSEVTARRARRARRALVGRALPPTVHGEGDHGFVAVLIGIAREQGRLRLRRRRRQPLAGRAPARRRAAVPARAGGGAGGLGAARRRRGGRADPRHRRGDRPPPRRARGLDRSGGRARALRLARRLLRGRRPGLERADPRAARLGARRSPASSTTSRRATTSRPSSARPDRVGIGVGRSRSRAGWCCIPGRDRSALRRCRRRGRLDEPGRGRPRPPLPAPRRALARGVGDARADRRPRRPRRLRHGRVGDRRRARPARRWATRPRAGSSSPAATACRRGRRPRSRSCSPRTRATPRRPWPATRPPARWARGAS